MRISIWRQDRKGAHWRRLGVVDLARSGPWPFKRNPPHGDGTLEKSWPRLAWYSLQVEQYDLFGKERSVRDVI